MKTFIIGVMFLNDQAYIKFHLIEVVGLMCILFFLKPDEILCQCAEIGGHLNLLSVCSSVLIDRL